MFKFSKIQNTHSAVPIESICKVSSVTFVTPRIRIFIIFDVTQKLPD